MAATVTLRLNGAPQSVKFGERTTDALRYSQEAEVSAAVALTASGPNYTDTASGLAATAIGDTFAVSASGIVTVYRHDAGPTATALRTLPTTAALASTATGKGAEMVGWIRSATGAVARTVADWFVDQPSVMDFIPAVERVKIRLGTSTADLSAYLQAAFDAQSTAGGGELLMPAGLYNLGSVITLPADVHLRGQAGTRVAALASNTATHFITIAGDRAAIRNLRFDGTNIDAPTAVYASGDYAGTAIYMVGNYAGVRIDNCTFSNFAAGPINIYNPTSPGAVDCIVSRCTFTTVQTYTANATNAVVAFHNAVNCRQEDCNVTGYNWKAFYGGNCKYTHIVRCHADGGVIGHASHFLSGGSDNSITDCTHTGTGFGVKCDTETRPTVTNFKLQSGYGAIYMQSCTDFQVIGGTANDPAAQALMAGGANGNCSGSFVGFRATRSTYGTAINHAGVYLDSTAAGIVDSITVKGCYFKNFYYPVYLPNSGYAKTNIRIIENEIVGGVQYGVIALIGSGEISRNRINLNGVSTAAAIFVARDGVTTSGTLDISNNNISGCTADNIQVGEGFRLAYRAVIIRNNRGTGGTKFLDYQSNANAADTVSYLEVVGNEFSGVSTGCTFTFNTTTSTKFRMQGNNLVNSSFAKVNSTWTNLTNVTFMGWDVQSGTITLAAGTGTVPIPLSEPDTSYRVVLGGGAAESFSWASKTTTQFTVNSSNGSSTATVNWMLTR